MTKTINPDVAAFKDDFFKGLSFRECVFGGIPISTRWSMKKISGKQGKNKEN